MIYFPLLAQNVRREAHETKHKAAVAVASSFRAVQHISQQFSSKTKSKQGKIVSEHTRENDYNRLTFIGTDVSKFTQNDKVSRECTCQDEFPVGPV